MNQTPRLRSAYPATPQSSVRKSSRRALSNHRPKDVSPLKPASAPAAESSTASSSEPLIPFDTIDAPTQRLYVFGVWIALLAWRLYDFWLLLLDDTESLWLFMKWVAIDATFLYGLPALRIPWLSWSSVTVSALFMMHAIGNMMLMFRIMPPFEALMIYTVKLFYDKELAISERRVKAGDILHNSSLILGKQVIHILPEGSALLNPNNDAFCFDSSKSHLWLPIMINQTKPISVELLRTDLETGQNETIAISSGKLKSLRKEAEKSRRAKGGVPSDPLTLNYAIKSTGIYRLRSMIDESKLAVRSRPREAVVVSCPAAQVNARTVSRCVGDLSDLSLEVEGVPPLKVKYRKTSAADNELIWLQSIQPRDLVTAASRIESDDTSDALAIKGVAKVQRRTVVVPLNITLTQSGELTYSVAEVEDKFGNKVEYPTDSDNSKPWSRKEFPRQRLKIHDRPTVNFQNCYADKPLRVAKGQGARLELRLGGTGDNLAIDDSHVQYNVQYTFRDHEDGSSDMVETPLEVVVKSDRPYIDTKRPGLYSLTSVSTQSCKGEIQEPQSCLLQNPPEPKVSISSTEEFDKCAGRPIRLRVQLDFVGTPPFTVTYKTERKQTGPHVQTRQFDSMSGEIMLGSSYEGEHRYTFASISDAIYTDRAIVAKNNVLHQNIKATPRAEILAVSRRTACLGDSVEFPIQMHGEGPWELEYQIVNSGKHIANNKVKVADEKYTLSTGALKSGGNYTLSLLSVKDGVGCEEPLNRDATFYVQMSKPKAAFATSDGQRSGEVLEGQAHMMPVRLSGERPWVVFYRNMREQQPKLLKAFIREENGAIKADQPGEYELYNVSDAHCPGTVAGKSDRYRVDWINRPDVSIAGTAAIQEGGGQFTKSEVCEGDEDHLEISLQGTPPFNIPYTVTAGSKRYSKEIKVPHHLASVRMDTSNVGLITYAFQQPGDTHYSRPRSTQPRLLVEQRVNSRPTAKFVNLGKTYSYCSTETEGEQVIPVELTGRPPFHVELEIKNQRTQNPETVTFPNIPDKHYDLRLPYSKLSQGSSTVRIRKIRDSRNCQRDIDDPSARVIVALHDEPTISSLDERTNFCVGDRLSFTLSGNAPFEVYYSFNGVDQRARSVGTTFRRIAEKPGTFTITGVKDKASDCKTTTHISKTIHEMPSVRMSKGRESYIDIHEGGSTEMLFEFGGTPPFEFTYTRSANTRNGKVGEILETRKEISFERSMRVRASEEGTYEVVAIKDAHCAYSRHNDGGRAQKNQKLLKL